MVRVGLATDLEVLNLPCCDGRLYLEADGERIPLNEPQLLKPAGSLSAKPIFRLQVAALKDELQARGIAEYLREVTGGKADAVFDAGTDKYKVRFGEFSNRAQAEAERETMAGLGLTQAWVTSEGAELVNPAFHVEKDGKRVRIKGRWLTIDGLPDKGIAFPSGRYRGRILVYLNDRSLLNVVNELELESYLRGVVPKEMGPSLYNKIEALKAQAVAARTYTVRNLGEFSDEGYDICSTPRCQVYGGMKVEHPLSDRAIRETAGEVAYFGREPAETFYGATCGGHTENVEVVFPLKRGDYLKGVPCMEAGVSQIAGDLPPGHAFPAALVERLLPAAPAMPAEVLAARLEHLALYAGLSVPQDELPSVERREVARFIASVFDLALDPRFFTENLKKLTQEPPAEWNERERRLAAFLVESGLAKGGRRQGQLSSGEVDHLLLELALYLGVLRLSERHFLAVEDQTLTVRGAVGPERQEMPVQLSTFRRQGDTILSGPLDLAAGDRLEIYWHRDVPVALVQPVEARSISLKRHAPKQRWTQFMSDSRLRQAVQARYPGFPFTGFEVISRGISGRVGKLRLLGQEDRTLMVEGLAVRWTLDVPDTWFYASRRQDADRPAGWLFRGRGWGHGVGMCQAGAFGMASRNLAYREILEHYYSGIYLDTLYDAPAPVLGP